MNEFRYDEKHGILTGVYDEHFNIEVINSTVLSILSHEEDIRAPIVKNLFNRGVKMLSRDDDEETTIKNTINFFRESVEQVSEMGKKEDYIRRAKHHIKYIKKCKNDKDKISALQAYLLLLQEFIKTNITYMGKDRGRGGVEHCSYCCSILNDDSEVCENCGLVASKLLETASFIDIKPTGDGGSKTKQKLDKDPYLKIDELYRRWRGLLNNIDEDVIEKIKKYMKDNDIQVDGSDKRWPKTLEVLIDILKKLKMTKYTPDINMIAFLLLRRPLPKPPKKFTDEDVAELMEEQFRNTQSVIEKQVQDGTSSKMLLGGWRLWHELVQLGFDCNELEFMITPNKKTRENLENIWNVVCAEFNWTNPYSNTYR